jgi:phosphoribosylaminoimidazolecarboxamide formyltransferase/IMP cyclohydrolase
LEKRQGIISVFDKTGIVEFCKDIAPYFSYISTGKTAQVLQTADIPVTTVSDFIGFPEILDGRVKTLHPRILGGILGTRNQQAELQEHGISPIGLVVVNLYPFEEVISRAHELAEALDNIDVGGVTLLRAAAKNYQEVLVVSSPDDYDRVAAAITGEGVNINLRRELAEKAFLRTARYDIGISRYLCAGDLFPPEFVMGYESPRTLRYGENPHQDARLYLEHGKQPFYEELHGKSVSLNNLVDFAAAMGLFSEHSEPSCAIIKHTSPCGFASAEDIETAFDQAFATDNLSAFGSAMGFNRPITESLANKIHAMFVDAVIAPDYQGRAFDILATKKNVVLCRFMEYDMPDLSVRLVPNGILVQQADKRTLNEHDLTIVTRRKPTAKQLEELLFAWSVVKYVKSNAAVISTGTKTLGVGMGQTSRIAAVELALGRAGNRAKGAVMASDAFFPYRDSVDAAANAGITAIIAPGGSIRDRESIDAADEADIAMVWSGIRSFLH